MDSFDYNLERDLNIIIEKIEDGEFQFKDIESQEVKGILDYFKILTMGTENYNVETFYIYTSGIVEGMYIERNTDR